jgi:hypothetical protein
MRPIPRILMAIGVCAVVACQPKIGPQGPPGVPGSPGTPGGAASAPGASGSASSAQGGTSGGGGWVTEEARLLIDRVKAQLTTMILTSAPEIFANLPAGWSPEKIADVIQNAREAPQEENPNTGGDRLMMWGSDASGPYIKLLRPFFWVYGATTIAEPRPYAFDPMSDFRPTLNILMIKMLHEVAHHWVGGEPDQCAKAVARGLFSAMHRNLVYCQQKTDPAIVHFHYGPFLFQRTAFGEIDNKTRRFFATQSNKAPGPEFDRLNEFQKALDGGDDYRADSGGVGALEISRAGNRLALKVCSQWYEKDKHCDGTVDIEFQGSAATAHLTGQLYRGRPADPGSGAAEIPDPPSPDAGIDFTCQQVIVSVPIRRAVSVEPPEC